MNENTRGDARVSNVREIKMEKEKNEIIKKKKKINS